MNSLAESSFTEIEGAIRAYDEDYYEIGERFIRSKDHNIEFTFSGLRRNLDSIKSKSRILLCWISNRAETILGTYDKQIPTVREEDSEVWVSYNPESANRLRINGSAIHRQSTAKIAEINWRDNPYFPVVLERGAPARLGTTPRNPRPYLGGRVSDLPRGRILRCRDGGGGRRSASQACLMTATQASLQRGTWGWMTARLSGSPSMSAKRSA